MSHTIVVLLPGRTASTLVAPGQAFDAGDPVWPAAALRDLSAAPPDEPAALAAMERTDLRPGVPLGHSPLGQGYGPFLRYFEGRGFTGVTARYAAPGVPAPLWGLSPGALTGDLLLSFPYDWRRDCTANAELLGNLLATVDGLYGPSGYRLFLVGHSMGGLVARAYLENMGSGDAWLSRTHGLVTLGTPHLGMPGTLAAILGHAVVPSGSGVNPAALAALEHGFADTAEWFGTFELLPPPVLEAAAEPPFTRYIQDRAGGAWYNLLHPGLPRSISEAVQVAAARGLPAPDRYAAHLAGAARFFGTLAYTGAVPDTALPPYRCVVGLSSAAPTVVGFTYDAASRSLRPLTSTGGDAVVPAWSAAFTGRTTPVADTFTADGSNHFQLPSDPRVLERVAAWIGVAPEPSARA